MADEGYIAYAFDEGTGTTTENLGTTGPSATTVPGWTTGKSGTGYALSRSTTGTGATVVIPSSQGVTWTVMGWFKVRSTGTWAGLFSDDSAFYLEVQGLALSFYSAENNYSFLSTVTLTADTWTHIAITSGTGVAPRFVVNGSTTASGNSTDQTTLAAGTYYIGGAPGEGSNMDVDDFRVIVGSALSDSEITTYMNQSVTGDGLTSVTATAASAWHVASDLEPIPVAFVAGGSAPSTTASATAFPLPYPAGLTEGDLLIALIGVKQIDSAAPTLTDWQVIASSDVMADGVTPSAGLGEQRIYALARTVPAGGLSGSATFTCTGSNNTNGRMVAFQYDDTGYTSPQWDLTPAATSFVDNTANTAWGGTGSADIDVDAGDYLLCGILVRDDIARSATPNLTLSATGATLGTLDDVGHNIVSTGGDSALSTFGAACTAGPSTAAPVTTLTGAGSEGTGGLFVRVRAYALAGTTEVSQTAASAWNVESSLTSVSQTAASAWAIDAQVQQTAASAWAVQSALVSVTATKASVWHVHTYPRPVRVEGRAILDGDGAPYFFGAYHQWNLIGWGGGRDETGVGTTTPHSAFDAVCSELSSQGFNTLLVLSVTSDQGGETGPNTDGSTWDNVDPWTGSGIGYLNETYWARVDDLIDTAGSYGITVYLYIMSQYATEYAGTAYYGITNSQATTLGTALGNRYRHKPNIVWCFGADYFDSWPTQIANVVSALAAAGDTHLFSVEFNAETSTTIDSSNSSPGTVPSTYAFSDTYSYNAAALEVRRAYNATTKPVVHSNGYYYRGGTNTTSSKVMSDLLGWAFTSGSHGFFVGSEGTWQNGTGYLTAMASDAWPNNVYGPVVATLTALPGWEGLAPSSGSDFVTSSRGTDTTAYTSGGSGPQYNDEDAQNNYMTVGRRADGALAVLYTPVARTGITVDTNDLPATYTVSWIDPHSGQKTATSQSGSYSTPGNNSAGNGGWYLVFEESATTPVTQTAGSAWRVLSGVEESRTSAWRVLAPVEGSTGSAWRVLGSIEATAASAWNVEGSLTSVTGTAASAWRVLSSVSSSGTATAWHILAIVGQQEDAAWDVLEALDSTRGSAWRVLAAVGQQAASAWDVLAATEQSAASAWAIDEQVQSTRAAAWHVGGTTTATAASAWNVDGVGLAVPGNLTATPVSQTQINLSWSSVNGATGYDVERDDQVIVTNHQSTTYPDTGLGVGTEHTYRVRARAAA